MVDFGRSTTLREVKRAMGTMQEWVEFSICIHAHINKNPQQLKINFNPVAPEPCAPVPDFQDGTLLSSEVMLLSMLCLRGGPCDEVGTLNICAYPTWEILANFEHDCWPWDREV